MHTDPEAHTSRHRVETLSTSTLSDDSIAFLKERLEHCLEQHSRCSAILGRPPTRLLRIQMSEAETGQVYLEDSKSFGKYEYATLSHCWGDVQPIKLTRSTEANLRAGVALRELPKTFRDAVYVCDRLGLRYIWIDSLSIFQDNLQDWEAEAAGMHTVYANAILNIAASGAKDSSVGLSFERNPLALLPFCLEPSSSRRVFPPDWRESIISESPLNKRAWVHQERFLSTRTVHFTVAGVHYECIEHSASEVYPDQKPTVEFGSDSDMWLRNAIRSMDTEVTTPQELEKARSEMYYDDWSIFVSRYTTCGLTYSLDKLVAFNGIAQYIKRTIGVDLVCGMWKHRLITELAWQTNNDVYRRQDSPPPAQWRAPSWSWANSDCHVSMFPYWYYHASCSLFEEVAEVTIMEVDTLPTGQVLSASLTLRGKTFRPSIAAEDYNYWSDSFANVRCRDNEARLHTRAFIFDRMLTLPHAEELTLITLLRCHCTRHDNVYDRTEDPRPTITALMLRQLTTTPPSYMRVGLLCIEGEEQCDFYENNQSTEVEDLDLV